MIPDSGRSAGDFSEPVPARQSAVLPAAATVLRSAPPLVARWVRLPERRRRRLRRAITRRHRGSHPRGTDANLSGGGNRLPEIWSIPLASWLEKSANCRIGLGSTGASPVVGRGSGSSCRRGRRKSRRTSSNGIGGDRRTEHLDIPFGRRFGIFADDVDMVEFEGGIAHRSSLGCGIGRVDRLGGRARPLR